LRHPGSFSILKGRRNLKDATREHFWAPAGPWRGLNLSWVSLAISAELFEHPAVVENARFGLSFAFADVEDVLSGAVGFAVAVGDVPADVSPCGEA
jgi:hypothetical protein